MRLHEQSAREHDLAAAVHDDVAELWEFRGNPARADIERRTAQLERDAAELQRDRARLESRATDLSLVETAQISEGSSPPIAETF
jgi:hypothetical protein